MVFGDNYLVGEDGKCGKFDLVYFDGLYNCGDRIVLTVGGECKGGGKVGNLPLIEQVLLTKWGRREVDWNGSVKIL